MRAAFGATLAALILGVYPPESTRTPWFSHEPLGGKTHFFGLPSRIVLGVVETIELQGEWIGHYPGHFDEVIRIEQNGDEVEAIKITGDDYVPAGAVTWRANLKTMEGEGQIAEMEFQHARFVPGRLVVLNPERIIFHWENCGEVEFRKDE